VSQQCSGAVFIGPLCIWESMFRRRVAAAADGGWSFGYHQQQLM